MDFQKEFNIHLDKVFGNLLPFEIKLELARYIEVNYIIPLKSELFVLQQDIKNSPNAESIKNRLWELISEWHKSSDNESKSAYENIELFVLSNINK